jgi:hypothetical protein
MQMYSTSSNWIVSNLCVEKLVYSEANAMPYILNL